MVISFQPTMLPTFNAVPAFFLNGRYSREKDMSILEGALAFISEEVESVVFQPTTLAYAKLFLDPYEQALNVLDDVALKAWVKQIFPVSTHENILDEMEELGEPNSTDKIRRFIMYQLVHGLLGNIEPVRIENYIDVAILPWDVAPNIYDEWVPLFGIDKNNTALPVTVTVNSKRFTHNMTLEQAMGLLLFSHVTGVNFDPTMFETSLLYFQDPNEQARFEFEDEYTHIYPLYRVTIDNHLYKFQTLDFVHGFNTGASWANIDPRPYWSNLQYLALADAEPKPIMIA